MRPDDYTHEELRDMGVASVGTHVRIHRSVQLFNCSHIHFGDNTRVDCFSVISAGEAGVHIGNCVHLAAGVYLFGSGGGITLEDFVGLSSRVSVYTASDDYVDGFMTNPTIPDEFRRVTRGDVLLKKHVIVGAGSVILPDVQLGVGAAIGALTCIRQNIADFEIWVGGGMAAKWAGVRDRSLLEREPACRHQLRRAGRLSV
ncbi:MAG: hypothetical protein R3E01_12265 [Pirellulaceae bacterium]